MRILETTLSDPARNLALDEALLLEAEEGGEAGEVLRLWESPQVAVVLGRSSRVAQEVDLAACHGAGVPVLRRCSGGAAVVIGPGCLMYALVLSYRQRPDLRVLDNAHRFVLERIAEGLGPDVAEVCREGVSDLTVHGRKFSGNSLRCKRHFLLYHGTFLYDFSLATISRTLRLPPRQPAYRAGREHDSFVANLPLSDSELRCRLRSIWQAHEPRAHWPCDRVDDLVNRQYARDEWNYAR